MNDFIARLRAEVVEATAREAARGQLQHSRHAIGLRLPRPAAIAAGLALAATLVAALSTVTPRVPAARPHVVATLHVGGQPWDAALFDGKLWVTDYGGRLIRADVPSGPVAPGFRLGRYGGSIATGDRGLWAIGQGPVNGGRLRLTQIDPRTGARVREFKRPGDGGDIAVGAGGVWLAPDAYAGGRPDLERLDPTTGAVTARVRADTAVLATAGDTLWVLEHDGTLLAVSGPTRQVMTRLTRLAPVTTNSPENTLAADSDGAWIADPATATLIHVVGRHVARRVHLHSTPGPLTLAAGAVWVTTGDVVTQRYRLLRVSPDTGHTTATVDLGHHEPRTLVPTANGVWVVTSDGNALRVGR